MMCDSGASFLDAHSKNSKSSPQKILSTNTTSAKETPSLGGLTHNLIMNYFLLPPQILSPTLYIYLKRRVFFKV